MTLKEGQDFLVCDLCGTTHLPDTNADGVRVLEVPAPLACPVCAVPLVHAAISGSRVLYCNRCHGMLISMAVFVPVVGYLHSRYENGGGTIQPCDWKGLNRNIECPQCRQTMVTHPYAGPGNVIMDTCEHCLLNWLDYGELLRIARAPFRPIPRAPFNS
jgi:Zn-finger nucleic acid-binding protein